jgi:hypothetical protein
MAAVTRLLAHARPNRRWYHERPKVAFEAIEAGQAVYVRSDGQVAKARANAVGTAAVAGFAAKTVAVGDAVTVVMYGSFTGWSGLTPGAVLYLSSATAGELDTAAPATGNYSVPVALAHTASEIELMACPRIGTLVP